MFSEEPENIIIDLLEAEYFEDVENIVLDIDTGPPDFDTLFTPVNLFARIDSRPTKLHTRADSRPVKLYEIISYESIFDDTFDDTFE